jgi:hypothetical protein
MRVTPRTKGTNTPVFFVRDPMKFQHFIRSQKRRADTNLRDHDMQWDFWTLSPESAHQVTVLMGDRGIPKSWRHMNGRARSALRTSAPMRTPPAVHSWSCAPFPAETLGAFRGRGDYRSPAQKANNATHYFLLRVGRTINAPNYQAGKDVIAAFSAYKRICLESSSARHCFMNATPIAAGAKIIILSGRLARISDNSGWKSVCPSLNRISPAFSRLVVFARRGGRIECRRR